MDKKKTYCRICEAHCGLEVGVEGEQVIFVKPDKTHPVSQGYVCIKGTMLGELHHDPDRVHFPMKRTAKGFERISWDQAIQEIGAKTKALRKQYGSRSIAHFFGNPTNASAQNLLYSLMFMQSMGSPNAFGSHSIDLNNKFYVADAMYGSMHLQPIPDLDRCKLFVCLGSNPMVSQMSVVMVPNVMKKLQAIEEKGGRVVIIDPRRTETAQKVGEHRFITPGTDAFLLMGMLHVIAHERTLKLPEQAKYAHGLEAFLAIAQPWHPERVEAITGVEAAWIRQLAHQYAETEGAALYMSTGVNMGPFGSIAYWLIQGLSLITGNLDAVGGLIFPEGPFDLTPLVKHVDRHAGERGPRTLKRGWQQVASSFPAAALEEEILIDHPQRIRALFVSAGNPVHSIPGNRLREAFQKLELIVSIDLFINETGQYADYVLPATDMLERSDFPLSHMSYQVTPHAQYTEAVVSPMHEHKPEWWIFSELAQAAGAGLWRPTLLNAVAWMNRKLRWLPFFRPFTPDSLLALLFRWGRKVTLAQLKKNPQGVMLSPHQPGSFLGKRVVTRDRKVDLAPKALLHDLERLEKFEKEFFSSPPGLRIIGRRERRCHNSWMHNNRKISHEGGNVAWLHPKDAEALGIQEGSMVQIGNEPHVIVLPAQLSEDIMQGVLCVPHGWGHSSPFLKKASQLQGANINKAIPHLADYIEPVSGQAMMLSHLLPVIPVTTFTAK